MLRNLIDDRPGAPARGSSQKTNVNRRSFLLALGACGAGVAAVAAGASTDVVPTIASTASNDGTTGKGYQTTDHVRRYYRTART